jgi:hypothetical protein
MQSRGQAPAHCCRHTQHAHTHPQHAPWATSQTNEFLKRIKACRIHMLIISQLRNQLPSLFGRERAAQKLLEDLPAVFHKVCSQQQVDCA